jgi:hypothetical protein
MHLDMVSATDIITYIGVPLAVLGVMPILYTFLSALYARYRFRTILRRSGFEASVRTRLMTGIVEVELPVFHLEPRLRTDAQYWWTTKKELPIAGTSWCHFDWSRRKQNNICVRLQSSDRIELPEAEIDFRQACILSH